jgi:hypothetical protein
MSRHFFQRLTLGYAGLKHQNTVNFYKKNNITCHLDYCNNHKTKYKIVTQSLNSSNPKP